MDKFDTRVKEARETYEPSPGFVDRTMEEVKKHKIRRRFNMKIWAPAAAGAFAVLAVVFVVAPKPVQNDVSGSKVLPKHKTSQVAPTKSPAPISDATDDASLARDLAGIAASMGQSESDQANADNAVNDNQQQISIPTN